MAVALVSTEDVSVGVGMVSIVDSMPTVGVFAKVAVLEFEND